ncbi:MAG TPA: FAD-binding oxidoreductase [bacterium]|nr:FAD-binding oxidoreductase [bacterium]
MGSPRDVVIVGGGISGTAAAYELARAGASVTLVEKGELASMASGWTLAGVRQSGRHPLELPLAQASVRRWTTLGEELEADLEYRQGGNLRLARTPEEVPVIARLVEEQRRLGLEIEFLPDPAAVRREAPALSGAVLAASYCPTDGHANPNATVRAFAAAARRHGAVIRTETEVTGITVHGERVTGVRTAAGSVAADVVVLAAGVHTDRLCAMVGLEFPLRTAHVAVMQTVPLPPLIRQVIGVANADFAGRQEVGGRVRMTGAALPWRWPPGPLGGDDVQPPASEVRVVLDRGVAVLPALAEAKIARLWGGLIDLTPDGLPVIERAPEVEGLVIAAGFSGHGFCLGPITGQLVSELITEGSPSLPLGAFRRARFAGLGRAAAAELHG